MREYRAFVLTLKDVVIDSRKLICEDDNDAKRQAMQLIDSHSVELWDGPIRIAGLTLEQ